MTMEVVALGDVASLQRDSIKPEEVDPATPYLGLEHVDSDGTLDWSESVATSGVKSGKYRFSGRHVLFGKLRPYLRKIARPDRDGVCSTDIIPVLPGSNIDRGYLFHFLRRPATVELATLYSSGANLPRLSPHKLAEFQIPLPPLGEQKRIAAMLDAADAVRAKRQESLEWVDKLVQSVFLDLFGDPVTNPKGWAVVDLHRLGDVQGGLQVTSKRMRNPIRRPYLRVANVFRSSLDLSEVKYIRATETEVARTELLKDDLLIVEGHGNRDEIGRCARWDGFIEGCLHQNHLIRVRCHQSIAHPAFVEAYINSKAGRRQLIGSSRTTSGLNTISVSKVKSVRVVVPHFPQQMEFARMVEMIGRQRRQIKSHLAELDTLFASLQSHAFRGEL